MPSPIKRVLRSLETGVSARSRVFRAYAKRALMCVSMGTSGLVVSTPNAFAYCLQNGCEDGLRTVCNNFLDPDDCSEVDYVCSRDENECINEGATLHRLSNCMSFAVAKGNAAALGLTDLELHDIIDKAFKRWQKVDCGGGLHPGFQIPSAGLVAAEAAYYCSNTKLNQSTWFLSEEWTRDPKALGFTFSTSGAKDGVVYDADVELNLGKIAGDFPESDWKAVLLSIATHEAGHFLGLAHSVDSDAVMYAAYNRTNLHERHLTQDDFDGICAVFPPNPSLECGEVQVIEEGLSEKACEAAGTIEEPTETETPSTPIEGSQDPLGEVVGRRGCAVSAAPTRPFGPTSVFTALLGVGLLLLRRKPRLA